MNENKKIIILGTLFVLLVLLTQVTGHLIWILGGINILWLLIKDTLLFSWWIVATDFVVFTGLLILLVIAMFKLKN